jgi:hypothetical protein
MTAPSSVDSARFLHISWPASPDLLRQMPTTFINGLMSAGGGRDLRPPRTGQSIPARTIVRNGYRHREFDTRRLDVAVGEAARGQLYPGSAGLAKLGPTKSVRMSQVWPSRADPGGAYSAGCSLHSATTAHLPA